MQLCLVTAKSYEEVGKMTERTCEAWRAAAVVCGVVLLTGGIGGRAYAFRPLSASEQAEVVGAWEGYTCMLKSGVDCNDCVTRSCFEYNETTCCSAHCKLWVGCPQEGSKAHCKTQTEPICRTPYMMTKEPEEECPTTQVCGEAGQPCLPWVVKCCAYDEEEECSW